MSHQKLDPDLGPAAMPVRDATMLAYHLVVAAAQVLQDAGNLNVVKTSWVAACSRPRKLRSNPTLDFNHYVP